MKQHTSHNIICLEAEWEYSEQNPKNRFSLNTLPMLNWLKEAYDCDVIYRRFRTKSDLKYYLEYFRAHAKVMMRRKTSTSMILFISPVTVKRKVCGLKGNQYPSLLYKSGQKAFSKIRSFILGLVEQCLTKSTQSTSKESARP